jgi:hypothetical protein
MELGRIVESQYLAEEDIRAIKTVAPHYMDVKLDLLSAIQTLHGTNLITKLQYQSLVQKFSTEIDSDFATFISDVLEIMSFRDFVRFLYTINCASFADELQVERYHRQIYWVEGRHVPGGSNIVKYYSMMKSLSDDNMLHDRKNGFRTFADDLEQELLFEKNRAKKQLTADRYATLMQLRSTFYANNKTKEEIIVKMKTIIPPDLDTTYSDMLYHSNFGVACAKSGNADEAHHHIQRINVLCFTCKTSYIWAFNYYYLHYIYRCLYSKNPSKENLVNALEHCHLGLNVLTELNQSDTKLIQRVFLLNLTQTLLGIRDDFSVDHSIEIDDGHFNVAKQRLNKLAENFEKIESRREMIYSLCKARTLQDEDLFLATSYLDRALVLGKEGAYLETNILNISAYQNWLILREMPQDF